MINRLRILWVLLWVGLGAWGVAISVGAWRLATNYAAHGTAARSFSVAGAPDSDAWRASRWELGAEGFGALADGDLIWRLSPSQGGGGGLALLSPAEGVVRLDWPLPEAAPLAADGKVVALVRPKTGGVAFAYETSTEGGTGLAAGIAGAAGWVRAPERLALPAGARVVHAAWRDGALELALLVPAVGGEAERHLAARVPRIGAPTIIDAQALTPPEPTPRYAFGAPWVRLDSAVYRVAGDTAERDDRYWLAGDLAPGPGASTDAQPAREAQRVGDRYVITRYGLLRASADPAAPVVGTARLLAGWSGVGRVLLHVIARVDERCALSHAADRLIVHPRSGGYWLTDIASGCYLALDPSLRRADDLSLGEVLARAGANPWALRWILVGLPLALALGLLLAWLLRARPQLHLGLALGAAGYVISASLLLRLLAPVLGAA